MRGRRDDLIASCLFGCGCGYGCKALGVYRYVCVCVCVRAGRGGIEFDEMMLFIILGLVFQGCLRACETKGTEGMFWL